MISSQVTGEFKKSYLLKLDLRPAKSILYMIARVSDFCEF